MESRDRRCETCPHDMTRAKWKVLGSACSIGFPMPLKRPELHVMHRDWQNEPGAHLASHVLPCGTAQPPEHRDKLVPVHVWTLRTAMSAHCPPLLRAGLAQASSAAFNIPSARATNAQALWFACLATGILAVLASKVFSYAHMGNRAICLRVSHACVHAWDCLVGG